MLNLQALNSTAAEVEERLRPLAKIFLLEGLTRADSTGTFFMGREEMARICGTTPSKIRRLLEILKTASKIASKTARAGTTVTIANIATYRTSSEKIASKIASKIATNCSSSSTNKSKTQKPEHEAEIEVGDIETELRGYWDDGFGVGEGPFPEIQFKIFRQEYGDAAVDRICKSLYLRGIVPDNPTAYLFAALERDKKQRATQPPPDSLEALRIRARETQKRWEN